MKLIRLLLFFALISHFPNLFAQYPAISGAVTWADTTRANALLQEGMTLKEPAKAVPLFQEAGAIWATLQPEGSLPEATACFQCGVRYLKTGKYDDALKWLQRALALQERLLPANDIQQGSTLHRIGLTYTEQGLYQEAIECLEKSVTIHVAHYGREHWRAANVISDLGFALGYAGYYERAITLQEEALAIRQKVLPPQSSAIARSCIALGNSHKSIRRYREALIYFQQALEIAVLADGENSVSVAFTYSEMGHIYLDQKDATKALEYFKKEQDIMVLLRLEQHPDFGYTCHDLGKAAFALGHYQEAIQWQKKAIELFQRSSGINNGLIASLHHYLGRSYVAEGNFEAAFAAFQEDRRIMVALFGPDVVNDYKMESDQADAYAQWYARTGADSLLEKSRVYYERAGQIIEKKVKESTSSVLRKKYLYDVGPIMEGAIAVEQRWLQRHQDRTALEKAWLWSETLHGFLLHVAAKEADARKFSGIPDNLLQREASLRANIAKLEKQRERLITEQELPLTHPEVLTTNTLLSGVRAEYDQLVAYFADHFPHYYQLKYDLNPVALSAMQKVLTPQQTLLEYFTGDSSIFVFVVRRDLSQLVRLPRDFPLTKWVEQLREGLLGYYCSDQKTAVEYQRTVRQYARVSEDLYQKLFAPIALLLTPEVIIIPDGELNYIPFEALLTAAPADVSNFKTYPFLLHQYDISYAYSATTLYRATTGQRPVAPAGQLLGFAPFFLGDTTQLAARLSQDVFLRSGFHPLPYSGEEVFRAKKRMKGRSDVFIGSAATREKFIAMAADYRILHLSTHSKANEKSGEFSYIAFAPTVGGTTGGLLYVGDVYNLTLAADLIILSACETGTGELQRGEGLISLSRAFSFAGAKSVATSLWKVSDQSTMQVMDHFYAALKQQKHKNIALTEAKRRYLTHYPGTGAHPFFWAGFVLTGAVD